MSGSAKFWKKEDFTYTPCYCEENVWKMCEKLKSTGNEEFSNSYAVFISNDDRRIPMWMQRIGMEDKDYLAVWDYHVVLLVKSTDGISYIADFDTVLNFVTPFEDYLKYAIRDEANMLDTFKRKFRIISSDTFLQKFASDRTHMIKDVNGVVDYHSPPPPYPPILNSESSNNIQDFISMDHYRGYGVVKNLDDLVICLQHGRARRDRSASLFSSD